MSSTKLGLGETATQLDAPVRASAEAIGSGQAPEGQPGRGDTIGRFVVLGMLGTGGMGNVYSAYDPHLDRKVAIKLLHTEIARTNAADARIRLLREAQAMAKINHPNVIKVHEVGTFGDQVYVAMEFANAGTLRAWLRAEKRPRRDILDRFIQAGRGLAGAHAEGLVHRDFKPDNVLLAKDGSVRVTDFGLVSVVAPSLGRAATSPLTPRAQSEPPVGPLGDSGITPLSQDLTRTGALMGTPSYMAPEQFAGAATDERTDQFSFCVALYEALYGERPFEGDNFAALSTAVLTGTPRPAPKGATVPGWMRRVLLRGLAREPAERYPAMTALLAALARDTASKRRVALLVAGPALAAAIAAGVVVHQSNSGATCSTGEDKIAAVWGAKQRADLDRAFVASGRPLAKQWSAAADQQVDAWTRRWSEAYVAACADTRVRGEQSEHMLDLRMECLTRSLDDMRATVQQITLGGTDAIDHALVALHGIPDVAPCADSRALMQNVAPPDPAVAAQVESIHEKVDDISALIRLGNYRRAAELASAALTAASATGYGPLISEAGTIAGSAQYYVGDKRASQTLRAALYRAAESGDQLHEIAAAAWLVNTLNLQTNELDAAQEIGALAEAISLHGSQERKQTVALQEAIALLESKRGKLAEAQARYEKVLVLARESGEDSDAMLSTLAQLAEVYKLRGKLDDARGIYERVLSTTEKTYGKDNPEVANTLNNLGNVYRQQGRYDDAKGAYDRALALRLAALGPDHAEVGTSMNNLGNFYAEKGDRVAAEDHYKRALAIWEKAYGSDSPELVSAIANLGQLETEGGDYAHARAHLERAKKIFVKAEGEEGPDVGNIVGSLGAVDEAEHRLDDALAKYQQAEKLAVKNGGADSTDTADALANEASVYRAQHKLAEAEELSSRALHITEKQLGADHPHVGAMLANVGQLHHARGDHAAALAAYQKSVELLEAKLGKDSGELALPLAGAATELAELARGREALPLAERALAMRTSGPARPDELGEARFALARAHAAVGGAANSAQARKEAQAALAELEQAAAADNVAEVKAWLAKHK